MKSKIIVFLLLITTIVGCGTNSDKKDEAPLSSPSTNYDDNGDKSSSPDAQNQDEDNNNEDEDEDEDEDDNNEDDKGKKDND
jgi:hypothetical protein